MDPSCSADLAAPASPLRVVPPQNEARSPAPGDEGSAALYRRVLEKVTERVRVVHWEIRQRPGQFGRLPMDRELTDKEARELAWRVYSLACATRQSVAWLAPELLIMASEWWASPVPDDWESLLRQRFR